MKILNINEKHGHWDRVKKLFPRVMKWRADPKDKGDYRFFCAVASNSNITGAVCVDIGRMHIGPLKKDCIAFIESLILSKTKADGTELMESVITHARKKRCAHIRGYFGYKEKPVLGLLKKLGFAIVPVDDPKCAYKTNQYLAVKPLD